MQIEPNIVSFLWTMDGPAVKFFVDFCFENLREEKSRHVFLIVFTSPFDSSRRNPVKIRIAVFEKNKISICLGRRPTPLE